MSVLAQGERIGDLFLKHRLVSEADLQSALEKQRQLGGQKQLGDLLVSMGMITERDRVRILGEHWGVEYIDLTDYPLSSEIANLISQDLARRYKIVPLSVERGRLRLAMKNPLDIFATDEIRLITGKEVEPLIATEEDILLAISNAYKAAGDAVGDVLRDFDDEVSLDQKRTDEDISIDELKELSEEAPSSNSRT